MIPLGVLAAARKRGDDGYTTWTPSSTPVDSSPVGWKSSYSWLRKTDDDGLPYIYNMVSSGLSGATYTIIYEDAGIHSDVDVIVDIFAPAGLPINGTIGPIIRAIGPFSHIGYQAYVSSNYFTIFKQRIGENSNTRHVLASVNAPVVTTSQRWRIRFAALGSSLKAKIWLRDTPEPSDWMVEATDDEYSSGFIGVAGTGRSSSVGRSFTEFHYKGTDGYHNTALNMGALILMDGFTNVRTGLPFDVTGTVTQVADDPYGHKALLAGSSNSYLSASVLLPTSFTMVGATSLVDGSPQTASRLIAVGDSLLGHSIGRTRTGTIRHVFTADPGNWHWFAMTVDGTNPAETSIIYRDGEQFSAPITRGDESRTSPSTLKIMLGGSDTSDRQIGTLSACAVFGSALTPAQIADLYAAYQKGP